MLQIGIRFFQSFLYFLFGIPLWILGHGVVPIALVQKKKTENHLPKWALLWDNPIDGTWGDARGWWENYCQAQYKKSAKEFYSMYQWLAWRNPVNYWSKVITGVDSGYLIVSVKKKWKYSQLLIGKNNNYIYPLFEGFIPYSDNEHGFYFRFGWKLELNDTESSLDFPKINRMRGSVFKFSPYKKR